MVQTRSYAAAAQSAAEGSAPLSVDAAMKTFHLPAGYRVELVASEPMIQDPVFIDWDADGRLWAVYDKRADIHEAFLSLGCAWICWQSLQKADDGLRG